MEESGLAAAYAAEQGMNRMAQPAGRDPMRSVAPIGREEMSKAPVASQISAQEVIALLQQGVTPEELVQNGVPIEILEQALELLQQQAQVPSGQSAEEQGLAGMYAAQGAV